MATTGEGFRLGRSGITVYYSILLITTSGEEDHMALMRKTKEEKAKVAAQLKAKQLRSQAGDLSAQARALSREAGTGLSVGAGELADRAAELAERIPQVRCVRSRPRPQRRARRDRP